MINKINIKELVTDIERGMYDDFKYSENDTVQETLQAMFANGVIKEFIESGLYQQ